MKTPPHHLDFPDAARSELESTIEHLVERAQNDIDTQGRLRHLLAVNRAVVEELDLEQVLRRIAEAAVELVGAQYGALGVIAPDGHLEQFIHVGIPGEEATAIGQLPEGHGLLGAVIDQRAGDQARAPRERRAIHRLPRASPRDGCVPRRPDPGTQRGLRQPLPDESADGPFSAEDQELVTSLAATAGVAIDNARLFDESRRRQRWSSALADVTSALLSGAPDEVLGLLADRVATVVDADLVCVIVTGADSEIVAGRHGARASR